MRAKEVMLERVSPSGAAHLLPEVPQLDGRLGLLLLQPLLELRNLVVLGQHLVSFKCSRRCQPAPRHAHAPRPAGAPAPRPVLRAARSNASIRVSTDASPLPPPPVLSGHAESLTPY